MLDRFLRPVIDPPLNRTGRLLAARGVCPNHVTLAGLAIGVLGCGFIVLGWFWLALFCVGLSRVADGLDGAVARATQTSDFGGYLDIVCDFAFYGLLPLAFILFDPAQNAIPGAILLTSFYINGATFLGYAALAERRGIETKAHGLKTIYFSVGLMEGTETIVFFCLICLFPDAFPVLAYVFSVLTILTALLRIRSAQHSFKD